MLLALVPPTSLKFRVVVPCAFVRVPDDSSISQTAVNDVVQFGAALASVVVVVEIVVVVVLVVVVVVVVVVVAGAVALHVAGSVQLPQLAAFRPVTFHAVPVQLQRAPSIPHEQMRQTSASSIAPG